MRQKQDKKVKREACLRRFGQRPIGRGSPLQIGAIYEIVLPLRSYFRMIPIIKH